jgi:ACR3 family arsenite transporter
VSGKVRAAGAGPGPTVRLVAWADHHQIGVYLLALAAGAVLGLVVPGTAPPLEHAIEPVLAALLFATFLQVPFTALTRAFRDARFLAVVLVVDFAVVPLVVWALMPLVPGGQAVLLGVLLVLLTPCVDYVIVFSGLAGGSSYRLLAATPLLMLAQLLLLPLYLLVMLGPEVADVVDPGPFVRAFTVLIAIPLLLALATELLARRHRAGVIVTEVMTSLMVPLLAVTLLVVVASQVPAVRGAMGTVAQVVPVFALFALVMVGVGVVAARAGHLDPAGGRAVVFSGVTRNSLVVLPLALALPAGFELTPVVVVTQTLVELVAMLALVRLSPRLVPAHHERRDRPPSRR